MPAVPQGEGKPLDPKTKKTILIGCIVAGALIVLGIVYGVLNSTVFSAKSMAESYVSAIASGDYDKANDIADPQVGKNQRKLLSNSVAKTDNATNFECACQWREIRQWHNHRINQLLVERRNRR